MNCTGCLIPADDQINEKGVFMHTPFMSFKAICTSQFQRMLMPHFLKSIQETAISVIW